MSQDGQLEGDATETEWSKGSAMETGTVKVVVMP